MAQQYTKEQIHKILQKLPEELQEAVFSMETADAIWNACTKQNISDDNRPRIAEYVGYILMGLILPQEFEQLLQKQLKLPKKIAQEIAKEISRFVFYPVKSALEQLHSIEVDTEPKKKKAPLQETGEAKEQDPQEAPSGPDTYREPLE